MSDDHSIILAKIEAYLRNELSETDRTAFETRMQTDSDLQAEVTAYRQIFNGFRQKRLQTRMAKIKAYEAQLPSFEEGTAATTDARISRFRQLVLRISAVAAALLLLLGIGLHWLGSMAFERVAQAALPPIERPNFEFMSGGAFERGEAAFFENNFSTAIDELQKVNSNDPNAYLLAQYYLAHSYAKQGQFEPAIASYTYVLEDAPVFVDLEQIEWELLLAYVGNHQFDAAYESALQTILTDSAHPFQAQARQLQQDVADNTWQYFVW